MTSLRDIMFKLVENKSVIVRPLPHSVSNNKLVISKMVSRSAKYWPEKDFASLQSEGLTPTGSFAVRQFSVVSELGPALRKASVAISQRVSRLQHLFDCCMKVQVLD